MVDWTEERLGFGFGWLGGVLLLVGALLALVVGLFDLATARFPGALGAWSETVLLAVLGALAILFTEMGHRAWRDRPGSAGVLLVVVGVLGWAMLGFRPDLVALIGALFAALAGVLYLIPPMSRAFHRATAA